MKSGIAGIVCAILFALPAGLFAQTPTPTPENYVCSVAVVYSTYLG